MAGTPDATGAAGTAHGSGTTDPAGTPDGVLELAWQGDVADGVEAFVARLARRGTRFVRLTGGLICVLVLLQGIVGGDPGGLLIVPFGALLAAGPRPLYRVLLGRTLRRMPHLLGPHRARMVPGQGITVVTAGTSAYQPWTDFREVRETRRYLVLLPLGRAVLPTALPKHGLTDPGQLAALRDLLAREVTRRPRPGRDTTTNASGPAPADPAPPVTPTPAITGTGTSTSTANLLEGVAPPPAGPLPPGSFELAWQPEAEDWSEAFSARAGRRKEILQLAALTGVTVAVAALGMELHQVPLIMGGAAGVLAVVLGLALRLTGPGRRWMTRRFWRNAPILHSAMRCRVLPGEGLVVETGHSVGRWTWEQLPGLLETPRVFILEGGRRGRFFVLVAKRGLADPARLDELRDLLQRETTAARSAAPR